MTGQRGEVSHAVFFGHIAHGDRFQLTLGVDVDGIVRFDLIGWEVLIFVINGNEMMTG